MILANYPFSIIALCRLLPVHPISQMLASIINITLNLFHILISQVTFKNEVTGEYLFYYLNFNATSPGVISTIEMVTKARQTTSASVIVENPLPTNLVFSAECRSTDISVPSQLSVPALSKVGLAF